jgi:murein DD-endopeptidase MepM/ murein hydrolase activator NlpD
MQHIEVSLGQVVKQGQVLGQVGQTGRATGPHLHWGVTWQKTHLDPLLLVD